MNKHLTAIIFGLAIVIAAALLGNAYIERSQSDGTLSVTGLGKTDFTSDLIVWSGNFAKSGFDLKQAYADLEREKGIIKSYLTGKGIAEENIVFNAVRTSRNTRSTYTESGKYTGEEFTGYTLEQSVQIDSKDVAKVEKVSREITELLNQGVQFYSEPPRYYFSGLEDLKIEMISRATENARLRAEKIATNSGASLGELQDARMGIFQITGQNSNEDYSWGGAFNTSSKEKTASITMKLTYSVD